MWPFDIKRKAFGEGFKAGEERAQADYQGLAWWFSEDKITCDLLLSLGERQRAWRNIWRIREDWRATRAAQSPPVAGGKPDAE